MKEIPWKPLKVDPVHRLMILKKPSQQKEMENVSDDDLIHGLVLEESVVKCLFQVDEKFLKKHLDKKTGCEMLSVAIIRMMVLKGHENALTDEPLAEKRLVEINDV